MDTTAVKVAISINPEIPLKFVWSGFKQVSLTSDSLKYETQYTITIAAGALDIYGVQFDGNGDGIAGDAYSFTFVTGPEDMTAPKVASFTPLYNSTNVELNPIITIFFDEKVDSTSITTDKLNLIQYSTGDTIPILFQQYYVGDVSVLHIVPTETLLPASIYKFYLEAGVSDLFGNTMTTRKLLRFTTG
jgi:hypothetical protein